MPSSDPQVRQLVNERRNAKRLKSNGKPLSKWLNKTVKIGFSGKDAKEFLWVKIVQVFEGFPQHLKGRLVEGSSVDGWHLKSGDPINVMVEDIVAVQGQRRRKSEQD